MANRTLPTVDPFGLRDRVAIVTGATRGIGRASAELLCGLGARVVVNSRSKEDATRVASELERTHGAKALGVAADCSNLEEAARLVNEAIRFGNRVDILVNHAGYPWDDRLWNTPIHEIPERELADRFERVWRVDFLASLQCTYACLPHMMRERRGSLIYTASTPALAGYKGAPYTAAKAAVLGLMRDVAREYGSSGVRANAIAPGNIKTDATWNPLPSEVRDALANEAALRRWGEPSEIAKVVAFLASDLSSFVSGQTIVVDGGTLMG